MLLNASNTGVLLQEVYDNQVTWESDPIDGEQVIEQVSSISVK